MAEALIVVYTFKQQFRVQLYGSITGFSVFIQLPLWPQEQCIHTSYAPHGFYIPTYDLDLAKLQNQACLDHRLTSSYLLMIILLWNEGEYIHAHQKVQSSVASLERLSKPGGSTYEHRFSKPCFVIAGNNLFLHWFEFGSCRSIKACRA